MIPAFTPHMLLISLHYTPTVADLLSPSLHCCYYCKALAPSTSAVAGILLLLLGVRESVCVCASYLL